MADDEDEFGLSSGDEEELIKLESITTLPGKRKREDDNIDQHRKIKFEDQDNVPSNSEPIKIKREVKDDEDLEETVLAYRPRNDLSRTAAVKIANDVLYEHFEFLSFRLRQEDVIARLLQGESAVAVFPTGGGKSLCYQVPAMCFKQIDKSVGIRQGHAKGGITLVVSPFITPMRDQVEELRAQGIRAAALNSPIAGEDWLVRSRAQRKAEHREVVKAMLSGKLDILFVTPERLKDESFRILLTNVKGGVRLLAVDEAHRVSEESHDFRRDYLAVVRFAEEVKAERILCLTATATPTVVKSICRAFRIDEDGLFTSSTVRDNLKLQAMSFPTRAESYSTLGAFLSAHPGPTIIFTSKKRHTEEVIIFLRRQRFQTEAFHDGMQPEDKAEIHLKFLKSKYLIIVTKSTFVEGISKDNIRNIIHYDIPGSLESYSQQIGRAGRDGLVAHCAIFLCADELRLRASMAYSHLPSRPAVFAILRRIFALKAANDRRTTIQAGSYDLRRSVDVDEKIVNIIWTQLELHFRLLTTATPTYAEYRWRKTGQTFWDKSPAASTIHILSKLARMWTDMDLDLAVLSSGLPRHKILEKLYHWHDGGYIDLKPSGVVSELNIGKHWPPNIADLEKISQIVYRKIEQQEEQQVRRMRQVVDLVTGEVCFTRILASYFGDSLPERKCGECTWCQTRNVVQLFAPQEVHWDQLAFSKVLAAVPARDDPRYLARIAFGIKTVRARIEKHDKSAVFGSMEEQKFMDLVKAFEKVCVKEEPTSAAESGLSLPAYTLRTPQPPSASTKPIKREFSRSASTGSYAPGLTPAAPKRTFSRSTSTIAAGKQSWAGKRE